MALSEIKSIKVLEKNINPSSSLVFDNYVKKFVSNYLISWGVTNDQNLEIFYKGNAPIQYPGISNVYRGYGLGGPEKKIVANAYEPSMPKEAINLTGVVDIDGGHIHGLAILSNKTITGWSMTGSVSAMGVAGYIGSNPSQNILWNQSRHAATGGKFLTNVKKIGADFQASFALLEGDILTGWGNMGETWIIPGQSSITRGPAVYFIDENKHCKDWRILPFADSGRNFPSGEWNFISPHGVASYNDQYNNSHLIEFGSYDQNTFRQVSTYDYSSDKWKFYWPTGIPPNSGRFSSFTSHNGLGILTISGGKLLINYDGNPAPFTGVEINGSSRALVGSFIRVNPSYDKFYNGSLFNRPSAANLPTSGFSHRTILLEKQGDIWITSNSGFSSWTGKGLIKNWRGLAYSEGQDNETFPGWSAQGGHARGNSIRGKYLIAFTDNEYIYTSNDTGNTWTQKTSLGNQNWTCAAISSGGKYQMVGAENGYVWKSNDYGQNWTSITGLGIKNWRAVAVGGPNDWIGSFDTKRKYIDQDFAEGGYLAAIASGDNFWTSYNYGDTWSEKLSTSTFKDAGWVQINYQSNPNVVSNISKDWTSFYFSTKGGRVYIASKNGPVFHDDNGEYPSYPENKYGTVRGYYVGYATPEIPFGSYPNIYLTGVKDFDIGENYIQILLNTGSSDSYVLSGWGNVPSRLSKSDGLKDVKKIVSTRDHIFALIKSGDTTVISGWGLDESNLDELETWLWQFYGGVSGWFGGFLNDYKGWTGIKDFDIGYNHGIAIFNDDKVSGWSSAMPPEGRALVGQINSRFKNIDERQLNFYLDTTSFSGSEQTYYTEISDHTIRYNTLLSRWELQLNNDPDQVAYRSSSDGEYGLIGTWDGLGNFAGQKLEITNSTIQSIYPQEAGEAYISAVADKDWIQVNNQNVIFPWNKTIAYAGTAAPYLEVINFPTGIYYSSNRLASFDSGFNVNLISNTYGINSSWNTGLVGDYSSVSLSDNGQHQTTVVDGGYIYTSSNTGLNWTQRGQFKKWKSVAVSRRGDLQIAIESSGNNGSIWISTDTGVNWADANKTGIWKTVNLIEDNLTKYIFVIRSGSGLVISDDIGASWYESTDWFNQEVTGGYAGAAFSSENNNLGKNITLVEPYKGIFVSNDYGNSFVKKSYNFKWQAVGMSEDGKYQLAATSGNGALLSIDSGNLWYQIPTLSNVGSRSFSSIAVSKDGKYQTVAANNGLLYRSYDYGTSWSLLTNRPGSHKWSSVDVTPDGYVQIASANSGIIGQTNTTGCVVVSITEKETEAAVKLYPTKDYPLTVYREQSGVNALSDIAADKQYELFLYQTNSKNGKWNLSLKYLDNNNTYEKIVTSARKSINEVGYALPPSGNWDNFSYRSSENSILDNQLHSGLLLQFPINKIITGIDTRTGYMQDITFNIDYSKILPNYSNTGQVYYYGDGTFNYSKFGGNISVEDNTINTWRFDQNQLVESNPSFAVNVARFNADTGVDWNGTIFASNYCSVTTSSNLLGPLDNDTPLRSYYIGTSTPKTWYILLKFYKTGWNFNSTSGTFNWRQPYIVDKSSNTKVPLSAQLYCPACPNTGGALWQELNGNQTFNINSGVCYHYQIRLGHPSFINSGGQTIEDRNIWDKLSTTGIYSGGYLWNQNEDKGNGDIQGLSLQRGREYRFIQKGPITSSNKLRIYPTSGVDVYEYDSSNPSDYNFIQVKINSENTGANYINWSKGDRVYIQNWTGSHGNTRGSYTIGKFYETDITGFIPDPSKPNFVKYSTNNVSGEWYIDRSGTNKCLGIIQYSDKIYPAEFWYLSGGAAISIWPNNLPNDYKINTAYAFIQSGNTRVPFYGTMAQSAKDININALNPSGTGIGQRHIWNGKFKIVGVNEFAMAQSNSVEYPNPGDRTRFDINICTDYNEANNPLSWEYLLKDPSVRSGISFFSGTQSSGYFFKNKDNYFYSRDLILAAKNSITNIINIPTTHARFAANELAFWTGASKNGPWSQVTGEENSIWGGQGNFFNVNYSGYPDPSIDSMFGGIWQIIQIYIPNTVNASQIYAKLAPKNVNPNTCTSGCRQTNFVIIDNDGLEPFSANGYFQYASGNYYLKNFNNYSQITKPVFKGNVNIWSSDPYFTKQIPLNLTGAIDYIKY